MDGKKKKNKRKKGNSQNKVQDDVPAIAEQSVVMERDDGFVPEVNHIQKSSCLTDVQNVGVPESNSETDRHRFYEERFVKLQEEIRQLEDEKNQWVHKEINMEEKIKLLQSDIETCTKKEAGLEETLKEIQNGNNSIIEKETFIDEVASRLDEVNSRLQEQVKELKESRDGLVQENIQLKESIALLEARLERMESETALIKSSVEVIREKSPVEEITQFQPEVTSPSVEKREQGKAAHSPKVKEVHIESDHHRRDFIAHEDNSTAISSKTDNFAPNYGKEMSESTEVIPSMTSNHNSVADQNGVENFSSLSAVMDNNPRISEDVVSVSLDDIQVQEIEPQQETVADIPVPISDAPLIGAPFRIISFFTKYVSGADLVEKDGKRSG